MKNHNHLNVCVGCECWTAGNMTIPTKVSSKWRQCDIGFITVHIKKLFNHAREQVFASTWISVIRRLDVFLRNSKQTLAACED